MLRFDRSEIKKPVIDQNGYLHADAAVTRAGVFTYHHPDGTITRELRHPDEVFKPESLASLKNRPVTDGHPAEGKLNPKNTKRLSIGTLTEAPEKEDVFVKTRLMVTDEISIGKIMREENPVRELSCGYDCATIKEDGIFQGEAYDHIQKDIIYNHVAIVDKGRAGPQARLVLDAADGAVEGVDIELKQDQKTPKQEKRTMLKINRGVVQTPTFKLDAVVMKIDEGSEGSVQVVLDQLDGAVAHIGTLETKNDELQGKLDELQGKNDELAAKSVIPPAQLAIMVQERADVLGVANHIGVATKLDDVSNEGIKKLIVTHSNPKLKLDEDVSAGYIQGRYDAIVSGIRADNEGLSSLAALKAATTGTGEETRVDTKEPVLEPREAFIADSQEMWKTPEAKA